MSESGFLDNFALWAILGLIPFGFLLRLSEKRRIKNLALLGARPRSLAWLYTLQVFLAAVLIFALARPYLGFDSFKTRFSGRDIMILLDISQSMLAKDESPSRLEFAKRKIEDLVSLVTSEKRGDRIGITLFSGASYLFCPLTTDYNVVITFARSVATDLISAPGSSINQAIERTAQSLKEINSQHPLLIAISDGEDNYLNLEKAIATLKQAGLKLYTLGVGTKEGQPIELDNGSFLKNSKNEIVVSKLNAESLRALGENSGGAYLKATLGDQDLKQILKSAEFLPLSPENREEEVRIYNEIGPFLVIMVLALFVISLLSGRREVLFALALGFFPFQKALAQDSPNLSEAYSAYEAGDFERAKEGFEAALKQHPNDPDLEQALGSSYYKLKQYQEASKYFESLAARPSPQEISPKQKFEAIYNLGNAELMSQKIEEAIENYEKALKIKEGDKPTTHNLEIARKMLQAQKEKQEKEKQQKKSSKDQQSSSSSSESSSSSSGQQNQDQSSKSSSSGQDDLDSSSQEQAESESASSSSREGSGASSSSSASNQENQSEGDQSSGASGKEHDQSQSDQAASSGEKKGNASNYDKQKLAEREADAWLDSLEDAPVLLQRQKSGRKANVGQTW